MRSARDEEFHAYVVEKRAGMIRSTTLLTAGDGHLAEDVVQSTLTRLYLAWPLFSKALNPDAYARRALVNALMDEHRRPWHRRERASSAVPELPGTERDAGTARTDAVHAALGELPPRMRAAVELVAYTGSQPVGFTLDKVPTGWTIRDNTRGVLVLAPEGADTTAESGPTSFEGTIAIMTASDAGLPTDVRLDDVRVGDLPAVIAHMKGAGDTRTLFAELPSGAYLEIQVWDGLGWDNERIADFAASVHITKDAELSVG